MPATTYIVSLGTQLDLTLHRLALAKGTTEGEVIRRAVATYASLQKYAAVYVQLPADDSSAPGTGLRKIALP